MYIHVLVVCHNILTVVCLFLAFASPSRLFSELEVVVRLACINFILRAKSRFLDLDGARFSYILSCLFPLTLPPTLFYGMRLFC